MESKKTASSGGLGLVGVLQIVFIVLKLCGLITWSWLWVLSPLWISLLIGALLMITIVLWSKDL